MLFLLRKKPSSSTCKFCPLVALYTLLRSLESGKMSPAMTNCGEFCVESNRRTAGTPLSRTPRRCAMDSPLVLSISILIDSNLDACLDNFCQVSWNSWHAPHMPE